jgi:DNA repair exonuclease SbcCD ATPase subunit
MVVRTRTSGTGPALGRLVVLSLGVLLLALPASAQQPDKPDPKQTDLEKRLDRLLQEMDAIRKELARDKPDPKRTEQIDKARADVKKQTAEVEKLQEQLREAYSRLQKAQGQLDELEGRPSRGSRGPGGNFGRFDWRGMGGRGRPPDRRDAPPGATDLDKRLDRLLEELEDLRKEIRRPPSR